MNLSQKKYIRLFILYSSSSFSSYVNTLGLVLLTTNFLSILVSFLFSMSMTGSSQPCQNLAFLWLVGTSSPNSFKNASWLFESMLAQSLIRFLTFSFLSLDGRFSLFLSLSSLIFFFLKSLSLSYLSLSFTFFLILLSSFCSSD